MSLVRYYEPVDTPIACFGESLEEAKNKAQDMVTELTAVGNLAMIDDQGFLLRDKYYDDQGNELDKKLYAWNVLVKRISYR